MFDSVKFLFSLFLFVSIVSCSREEPCLSIQSFSDFDGWFISSSSASFGNGALVQLEPKSAEIDVRSSGEQVEIILSFSWVDESMRVYLSDVPVNTDKRGFYIIETSVPGSIVINGEESLVGTLKVDGAISFPVNGCASASLLVSGAMNQETLTLAINELTADSANAGFYTSYVIVEREATTMNVFFNSLSDEMILTMLGGEGFGDEIIIIPPFSSAWCPEMDNNQWPSLEICELLTIAKSTGEFVSFKQGEGFLSGTGYDESQVVEHVIRDGILVSLPWTIHSFLIDSTLFPD